MIGVTYWAGVLLMFILMYAVIFVGVGYAIGKLLGHSPVFALGLIAVITYGWFFHMGFWAIATFFELIIGYSMSGAEGLDSD